MGAGPKTGHRTPDAACPSLSRGDFSQRAIYALFSHYGHGLVVDLAVLGLQLDLMILKVLSNLKDSTIFLKERHL